MKKILFPTDFSKMSINAFVYALYMAENINAEIIVLHAYQIPYTGNVDYNFMLINLNINEWNEFENFKSVIPKFRTIIEKEKLEHVTVNYMLQEGEAATTILDVSDKENVDFIIMGTNGASELSDIFLGSVTDKITTQSRKAVLAIPANCHFKPIKKILFLTHFKNANIELLKSLYGLATILHAHIDVLEIREHHNDNENEIINKWRNLFPKGEINFYILTSNDDEHTAIDFMDIHKIDMMAMPVHQKGFFAKLFVYSLSRKLGYHSTIPLLGIPKNDL